MPRTVLTFGTFDVFHVGHLRVIERAAALGDRLVVGVSADALNLRKKGREPVFSESERLATIRGVFPEWERSIWGPDETCARGPKGERVRPMRTWR